MTGEFNSCSSFWVKSQTHFGSLLEPDSLEQQAPVVGEGSVLLPGLQEGESHGRQLASVKGN